ncbi:MAG: alpha-ketoacid dehydrogenase subunit beta [Pseudomonadota bacterium]|nr:alpha-ketoacid dehydrogenase subunit beta [Pseudomonadota bacterium]
MSKKSFRTALNEAMRQEMERDPTVIALGEDIAGGMGAKGQQDAWGDVLGASKGLLGEFGRERIFDTPISESAFIGAAAGAAVAGLRPIAQLMFVDFFGVCGDQIINQMAKFRYMFGGRATTPVTIRTLYGAGLRAASQHSQCLYPVFTHVPGLKVVIPSSPYEAKGLMIQSIRDDDPVIFFEHKALYEETEEVPDEPYAIPLGQARVARAGRDASIVTCGRMVRHALAAAQALADRGIDCEVIDLRTTSPLDTRTVLASVEKTGRLVVVDEANPRCNIATDISALVAEAAFGRLKAPIRMVCPPHTPVPFAPSLEDAYIPGPARIEDAVRGVVGWKP